MDGVIKRFLVQRIFTFRCLFFFSGAVSPEEVIDESRDITVIILILLAVIILALLIVFFIIFYHRRRRNKTKGTFNIFVFFVRHILIFILKRFNVTATKLYLFLKNMI